jgi:hypothetical protein
MSTYSKLGSKTILGLRNQSERLKPLLQVEPNETFTVVDLDGDRNQNAQLLKSARDLDAVETVGQTYLYAGQDGRRHLYRQYKWEPRAYDVLKEYLQGRSELPCGHRAHIKNSPKVDGLSCKWCIENGDYPEYSREMVKELL